MVVDTALNMLIITRLSASILFGAGIGLERELTNKYAGLRTHILVCLGSCIFTILSIYAFPQAVDKVNPQAYGDPARIAAQILTGIGFIGGGTVLRHGSSVYGLTTAATLWVAAAIGMACGAGMFLTGFIASAFSVGILVIIRSFERNILDTGIKNTKRLKIVASCNKDSAENIYDYILENFDYIHEISKKAKPNENNLIEIIANINVSGKKQIQNVYKEFKNIESIESISIQEDDE